jgi:hypothetical protein
MEARKSFQRLRLALPLLSLFSLFLSPKSHAQAIGIQGVYAESSDFWKQVDRLKSSADTAQILSEIFEETRGKATEGLGSVGIYYASKGSPLGLGFLSRGLVLLETEGVAGGYVRNEISPEIAGYTTWAVSLSTGVQRHLPVHESGWGMLLLSTSGIGKQNIIKGEVTSYLSEASEEKSNLYYQGFDVGFEFQSLWSDNLRFRSGYFFLPTYFYSQSSDQNTIYQIDEGRWSLRWRTQFETTIRTADFDSGALEVGGQIIAGPQPIPMPILPRIWDGVHKVNPKPAFGSAVGFGGLLRLVSQSRRYSLEGFGGFYGGYWGTGLAAKAGVLHIRGGTFGVEQSSNYQLRQTRVNFIDGGFSYAW